MAGYIKIPFPVIPCHFHARPQIQQSHWHPDQHTVSIAESFHVIFLFGVEYGYFRNCFILTGN